ncbi:MAG: FAD-dependent monooxygenase, partial [Pseudomonadota bacterium]|nr:FAD-dependent monooxygenase [Pseudomonadota bacterium]
MSGDIAIVGAGPVGMALAALLARRGVAADRIALVDGKSLGQAITDPRSIALSFGSRLLLEEIGAWPLPATPIHQIHISRRGHFGRSMMERDEHKLPALGYVTRYGELVSALAAACDRAGIQTIRPARVNGMTENDSGVSLELDDGRQLKA